MYSIATPGFLICCIVTMLLALAGCRTGLPFDPAIDSFNTKHFIHGMQANADECRALDDRVWVEVEKDGYCLRIFGDVSKRPAKLLQVYMTGDISLADIWAVYESLTPANLGRISEAASHDGTSTIILARPGTFGSSGNHGDDPYKSGAEARIMNAGLDALKRKYDATEFNIVGQSGGGHIAAYLLTRRSDLKCAVLSSAPLSGPRLAESFRDASLSADFLAGFWDPITNLNRLIRDPERRVFVLNDRNDRIVPYESGREYTEKGSALGHDMTFLDVSAKDQDSHGLMVQALAIGVACGNGMSTEKIRANVKNF